MIPEQEQAKPYQIDWFVDQLVRSGLYADPQSVWRSSLRALFEARPEEKRHMLASAYERGDVSLGKAAELMGVSQEEMEGDPARIRRTFILALRALRSYFADADNA
ncbi:MAG: UPF0175 family protein [Caldilineaceae bacterium]